MLRQIVSSIHSVSLSRCWPFGVCLLFVLLCLSPQCIHRRAMLNTREERGYFTKDEIQEGLKCNTVHTDTERVMYSVITITGIYNHGRNWLKKCFF